MRSRRRPQAEADVDMTPMLDIVFILLIFFIVTAVFVQEKSMSMLPPPPVPPTDKPEEQAPVILIQINDRNVIFVNQTVTDVRRVGPAIERFRADNGKSAVLIVPNDEADHGIVVSVFDAAKGSGAATMIQREKDQK
ncbi:Biopolymer transport protein ExbD/TolR [hydrothermal vent metagenome]|uniref:Biopolymer transport protein ExbD/TolR n=1 Tax=hydrothermal vent metagenome TaxID=652676 RepID=A0A3B0S5F0_9ZZZZ